MFVIPVGCFSKLPEYIRKDIKPLDNTPISDLIDAYINSRPYTSSPKYDTFNETFVIRRGSNLTPFLSNPETFKQIKSDDNFTYWRAYRADFKTPRGSDISTLLTYRELFKEVRSDDSYKYWRYTGIGVREIEGGQPVVNAGSQKSNIIDYEYDFNALFTYQPGYTLDYNSMVAFRIPEFYSVDTPITYAMWVTNPETRGLLYIYPYNQALGVLDFIDVFNIEDYLLKYAHGVLWSMYDNIAFENVELLLQVPITSLPRKAGVELKWDRITNDYIPKVQSGQYGASSVFPEAHYHKNYVAYNLDDLNPAFHPLSGNFKSSVHMNFWAIYLVMNVLSRIMKIYRNRTISLDKLYEKLRSQRMQGLVKEAGYSTWGEWFYAIGPGGQTEFL